MSAKSSVFQQKLMREFIEVFGDEVSVKEAADYIYSGKRRYTTVFPFTTAEFGMVKRMMLLKIQKERKRNNRKSCLGGDLNDTL